MKMHYTGFMKKNKEIKKRIFSARFVARICVINLPAYFVLTVLLMAGEIDWRVGLMFFVLVSIFTVVITAFVFQDLENFIGYLKRIAADEEIEMPRFQPGIFSSKRLADVFMQVMKRWREQTISDARILENLPDVLLMLDETGRIVFANHLAVDFFGEQIRRQNAAELFQSEEMDGILKRLLSGQMNRDWFEWTFQDEQVYVFRIRAEVLPAKAKNGAVAVLVFHDITPFKLFEKQQVDFFANASHELKTPLSIVSGFIETLQGPAKDDEAARGKFLQMMAEQTARMTHLVQDLLALSKAQMRPQTVQNDVILIPALLQGVVDDLTLKADKNDKKLSLSLEHELPRLMGNRAELQRVFQNLIDNAIKYGQPHSTISIRATLCNNFPKKSTLYLDDMRQVIGVSIHNQGNPIPKQDINRLFERFYRLDMFKSKKIEGTGLGLGIAQQIVHKHEGMIDISSSAEKGTTFTVYLPVNL